MSFIQCFTSQMVMSARTRLRLGQAKVGRQELHLGFLRGCRSLIPRAVFCLQGEDLAVKPLCRAQDTSY